MSQFEWQLDVKNCFPANCHNTMFYGQSCWTLLRDYSGAPVHGRCNFIKQTLTFSFFKLTEQEYSLHDSQIVWKIVHFNITRTTVVHKCSWVFVSKSCKFMSQRIAKFLCKKRVKTNKRVSHVKYKSFSFTVSDSPMKFYLAHSY